MTPQDDPDSIQTQTPDRAELLAALRESERKYHQFIEHAHEGFWIIDENAITTLVNPQMAEMLGYTPEEMLGMPLHAFMDEQGKKLAERNIERRRQGIKEQHNFEFIRKDGVRIYTSMDTSPTFDAQGGYTGAIAFVTDITKRLEAEKATRHLAAIVESTSDGIMSTSRSGTLVSWNQGAERIFGYTKEEVVGKPYSILRPPRLSEEGNTLFHRALEGERITQHDTFRLNQDGSEIPVSLTLSPMRDPQGSIMGVAAIVQNITKQVDARRELVAANQLLTSIIECAGEGFFVKDADLCYRLANSRAAQMMGVEPAAIVGKFDLDFAPPEIAAAFQERDLQVMQERRSMTQEYPLMDSNGKEYRIAETKAPLFGEDDEVIGVVGVVRDVTEEHAAKEHQRVLETQMLHSQKLKSLGLLAGGIAHDFNNLLVAILGNADLAAMELAPTSPIQEDLAAIGKAARRASDLCRQLLAYAGRGRFVVQRTELSQAVADMAGLLEVTLSKRAILQLNLSDAPVFIKADIAQLRQIVMNLITNASEAVESGGGVIRVTTGMTTVDHDYLSSCVASPDIPAGTYAFLEVSDTGTGMNRETLDKIFDPFFTSKFTGRGLGLAAVLGIVRGHDGAIRVYSEPGRGSSFKVLFPALQGAHENTNPAQADVSHSATKGVVLVVDDEPSVLQFARRALTRSQYEVITASSGEEGVARFQVDKKRIIAVLLDMTMPGMDGRETYSELRRIDADIPIILSSGFNEQEATSHLAGRGLAGFLAKPYSVQDLLACLRKALNEGA